MSYWLRHDPEDMEMDERGFVKLEDLIEKLSERFPDVTRELVEEIVNEGKKRYEIDNDKIRATYGHSLDIDPDLTADEEVKSLYKGTTSKGAYKMLINGIECRDRNMVHLSSTKDQAEKIGKRRTDNPVILKVDAKSARENGLKFYKATENIYLSSDIPVKYIEKCEDQ